MSSKKQSFKSDIMSYLQLQATTLAKFWIVENVK